MKVKFYQVVEGPAYYVFFERIEELPFTPFVGLKVHFKPDWADVEGDAIEEVIWDNRRQEFLCQLPNDEFSEMGIPWKQWIEDYVAFGWTMTQPTPSEWAASDKSIDQSPRANKAAPTT